MNVAEYVSRHAVRGACQCGKCFDAPANPDQHQPIGHTADLVFFKVAAREANRSEFERLVNAEFPHWLDGKEHSYLDTGGDIGDQGLAMMAMGLGAILGTWKLMTPAMLDIPDDLKIQMAGVGFITIQAAP